MSLIVSELTLAGEGCGGQAGTQTWLQTKPTTDTDGLSVDTADFVPTTLSSGIADDNIPF